MGNDISTSFRCIRKGVQNRSSPRHQLASTSSASSSPTSPTSATSPTINSSQGSPIPEATKSTGASSRHGDVCSQTEKSLIANERGEFSWMDGRRYHDVKGSSYLLPNDLDEEDRLITEHYLFRMAFNGNVLAPVHDTLKHGGKVLDIGCGTGVWLLEVAEEFPQARCCGIDMSPIFPTTVKPKNLTFVKANALDGLPFEENTFDLVHMRFLIMAFRKTEWSKVISEIMRVTKPGGYIQFVETAVHVLRPGQCSIMFNDRTTSMLALRDQDATIATKLHHLIEAAGFLNVERKQISLPLGWKGEMGDMTASNLYQVACAMRPLIVKIFGVPEAEVDEMINGMKREWPQLKSYLNAFAYMACKPNSMNFDGL